MGEINGIAVGTVTESVAGEGGGGRGSLVLMTTLWYKMCVVEGWGVLVS